MKRTAPINGLLAAWDSLVAADPKAPALVSPEGFPVNRATLFAMASEHQRPLEDWDISRGSIVLLHAPNGPGWLASLLGILRHGCVCLPIDADTETRRAREIAHTLRAAALLSSGELTLFPEWRPRRFRNPRLAIGKSTSGSTGTPKVFYFTDAEIAADGRRVAATMGITPRDINLGLIPWGHSYGLGNIVAPLLLQGTAAAWCDSPLPHPLAHAASATRATVFPSVPTVLKALARSDLEPALLAGLRLVVSAGSRLDPAVARAFKARFGTPLHNFYGSSETGALCYDTTGDCALSGRSVGSPMPGVEIVWLPNGRFRVRSDAVYTHGNRTAQSPGVVRTADKARLNEHGELVLLERARGFAKIGGRRVSLTVIESALLALPGVSQARAMEIIIDGEPCVAAALECKLPKQEITAQLRETLAPSLRPKRLLVLPRFPVTARGKTDLARLEAMLSAR